MKKGLLLAVAVLLPALPLAFWLAGSWQEFSEPLGLAFFALYVPSRAFGLVGFVLMFYQFILASRLPFLEKAIKRADQLKTHRTLGKVGGILMLTHGMFMLMFDLITLGAVNFTVGKLIGIIALFLVLNAVIAAWFIKPLQLKQPTWRRIHQAAYIVFPLVFVHAILIGNTARGYLPVRILFIVFLGIYGVLVIRRLAGGGPAQAQSGKARASSPGRATASAPPSSVSSTAGAGPSDQAANINLTN